MVRLLRVWLIVALAVLWLPAGGASAGASHGSKCASRAGANQSCRIAAGGARYLAHHQAGRAVAYPRDGVVFGNYERVLPKHPRGYYHEYTVKTPGVRNRGARRIISGEAREYYFTADHYKTFKRIQE